MMKKYRIMVIDDDFKMEKAKRLESIKRYFTTDWIKQNNNISKRDDIIKLLPTEFDLIFCSTMNDFLFHINESVDVHAFFIDYVLFDKNRTAEEGDFKDSSFISILNKIKEKYNTPPIYVYSSKWDENLLYNLLDDFSSVFSDKIPNQVLTFKNFESAIKDCQLNLEEPAFYNVEKVEQARKQIWNAIATQKKHVPFQPSSPSGDIVILHISDLQFGDKYTTKNDAGIWNNMEASIRKCLDEKGLNSIDLIVITGDVAMTGKKTEFKEAIEELNLFFKRLWGNSDVTIKDRIIVVPGNHDFDINTCVLECFKAENKENDRTIDFESVVKQIQDNEKTGQYNEENEYRKLGLQAFREFAYKLTQDDQYILSDNLDFIIDKFNNWGLRFICLNSVYRINAQKTNCAGINKDSIRKICDEIHDTNFLTILLVHHTLLSNENLSEEEASSVTNAIRALQRAANAKIVMGGHRHKNDTGDESNSAKKTLRTLEAASLRVEDETDDYVRGFGLVTIKSDLKQVDLQYFTFHKEDGEIKRDQGYKYEIE